MNYRKLVSLIWSPHNQGHSRPGVSLIRRLYCTFHDALLIVSQFRPLSGCGLFLKLLITSALTSGCKGHVSLLTTSLWSVALMLKCFDKKPLLSPRFCFYGRIVYPVGFKTFASCFLCFFVAIPACVMLSHVYLQLSIYKQNTWNAEIIKRFFGASQTRKLGNI